MPPNSILATADSPLDAESERLFALMDANGDGQLTEAEGHKVADAFDCNKATFWSLLLKYDADGDGKISVEEALLAPRRVAGWLVTWRELFVRGKL